MLEFKSLDHSPMYPELALVGLFSFGTASASVSFVLLFAVFGFEVALFGFFCFVG